MYLIVCIANYVTRVMQLMGITVKLIHCAAPVSKTFHFCSKDEDRYCQRKQSTNKEYSATQGLVKYRSAYLRTVFFLRTDFLIPYLHIVSRIQQGLNRTMCCQHICCSLSKFTNLNYIPHARILLLLQTGQRWSIHCRRRMYTCWLLDCSTTTSSTSDR